MWALIINLIYQQTCRNCLASMARHQHRWIWGRAEDMLAEKFMLFLEALISANKRDYPDGAPRVVSTSPHVPVKLPSPK
jgi:hypothetical protein